MTLEDLTLVRGWRNHENIRKHMFNQHEISEKEHHDWFSKMGALAHVHLLIFELNNKPSGFAKLEVSLEANKAVWGFYTAPNSEIGTGKKLAQTVLAYAFEALELDAIDAEVIRTNKRSLAFHESMGFNPGVDMEVLPDKNSSQMDIVCMTLEKNKWLSSDKRVSR